MGPHPQGEGADLLKFALCNEMFEGWAWEHVCKVAKDLGYDGIEIAPYTFSDDVRDISAGKRARIAKAAEECGLEVVGTHWLLVKPSGMGLFSPDPEVREFTAEYLIDQVDFCSDIGGKVLTFGSPSQRNVPSGKPRAEAESELVGVLRRIGDRAVERGVKFCLEPLPPSMTNLMETVEEAARIAEEVDSPGVGFMLDVKSICAQTDDVAGMVRKCSGRFCHFHANDSNLRGPGTGNVDFTPIMKALVDTGYEGYVSVEVFDFKPDPVTIARDSIAYLRSRMP